MPKSNKKSPLQKWEQLSSRERGLFLGVLALAAALLVFMSWRAATAYLQHLDSRAMQLEDELVNYTYQLARKGEIASRWTQIAAQHSSAWSEAEIKDRLRLEVYRLADNQPSPLNEKGIPVNTSEKALHLVEIPGMGEGAMLSGGEGYREYQQRMKVPATSLPDMLEYLSRLQVSPQALRIDNLDLSRAPESLFVDAEIVLTRTVVAGLPEGLELAGTAAPQSPGEPLALTPESWQGAGATLTAGAGDVPELTLEAASDGATSSYAFSVEAAGVYELFVDVTVHGTVTLAVSGASGILVEQQLPTDGQRFAIRVRVNFAEPGTYQVPLITFSGAGDSLVLHSANVRELSK